MFVRLDTANQPLLCEKDIRGKIARHFMNEKAALEKRQAKEAKQLHSPAELEADLQLVQVSALKHIADCLLLQASQCMRVYANDYMPIAVPSSFCLKL